MYVETVIDTTRKLQERYVADRHELGSTVQI
jgi:hypothetical protein